MSSATARSRNESFLLADIGGTDALFCRACGWKLGPLADVAVAAHARFKAKSRTSHHVAAIPIRLILQENTACSELRVPAGQYEVS
jgi:glucokinase